MANKYVKTAGAALLVLCLLFVFGYRCPFQALTGFPCPGCNFTTALIFLLKGDIVTSLWYHAMVIPTLLLCIITLFLWYRKRTDRIKRLWLAWGIAMLVYNIVRMAAIFPESPMVYDQMSLAGSVFRLFF